MQAFIAPPTTAPRSSDRGPDASQFSQYSREVRDLASLISWTKVGLTPAPAPISAHLPARVFSPPHVPGPFAPLRLPLSRNRPTEISWQVTFPVGSVGCETVRWQRNPQSGAEVAGMPGPSQPEPTPLPPPRAFHVEGSARDCLPGSLSGSSGWRFPLSGAGAEPLTWGAGSTTHPVGRTGSSILPTAANFPSSYIPARLAVCALRRRTRPVSEVSPMPGVCFVGVQPEAPVAGHANHGIQMPHPCREVRILRPLPISPEPIRG